MAAKNIWFLEEEGSSPRAILSGKTWVCCVWKAKYLWWRTFFEGCNGPSLLSQPRFEVILVRQAMSGHCGAGYILLIQDLWIIWLLLFNLWRVWCGNGSSFLIEAKKKKKSVSGSQTWACMGFTWKARENANSQAPFPVRLIPKVWGEAWDLH